MLKRFDFKDRTLPAAVVLLLVSVWPTAAQIHSQLSGTVMDNSGAVVVGAGITLHNVDTGVIERGETNASGIYSFPFLQSGSYELTCELQGFKKFEQRGLAMETGASRNLDIKLELGALTETVSVTGTAALLDAETSSVGQFVERAAVSNMPLDARRVTVLVRLMGNVSWSGEAQSDASPNFAMAGGRSGNQMWNLDGGVVQNMSLGAPLITMNPPAETIQEFKMEANNFSSEFGRAGSGLINMTTRSGGNEFHGAAYEFLRNEKMDARSFFAPKKAPYKYNIFGASISGPIRKNKTFFYGNFEGDRRDIGSTIYATVPHPAEQLGDFSARNDLTLTDPLSKTPFPGNRIPSSRIDPIAAALIKFYPSPNLSDDITKAPSNNYLTNVADTTNTNCITVRGDHLFDDANRMFVRYNYIKSAFNNGGVYPTPYADYRASVQNTTSTALMGSWIRNIKSNLINELRLSYTLRSNRQQAASGNSEPKLGIPGVDPLWFPAVSVAGMSSLGLATWRLQTPVRGDQAIDTLTWIKGRHQIKTGFEFRYAMNGEASRASAGGSFSFSNRATGSSIAELLLGWAFSGTRTEYSNIDSRSDFYGAFIQDDWKVSQKLTLNLGVRWDMDTPRHALDNRQSSFDGTPINPVSGTPGIVTFAGLNGYSKYAHDFDPNNLGPRFGFAYRYNDKLIVRGGYGIYYNGEYGIAVPLVLYQGFSTSISVSSPDGGFTPALLLSQGLPAVAAQPLGPGWGAVSVGGTTRATPDFIQKNHVNGYMQQWNLTIQRQLAASIVVEAAYVSNIGHKLASSANISTDMIPLVNGRGPAQQSQTLRPYPQFSDVTWLTPVLGDSNYQSLNLKFEKRYSNGFNLLSNFTWSKYMQDVPGTGELGGPPSYFQHVQLHKLDWSMSGSDVPKRWVTSLVYDLPFGKGRHRTVSNPFLNGIIGRWGLGLIADMRSGAPWGVTELTNTSNTFSTAQRPNLLRNPNLSASRSRGDKILQYFDTTAFQAPAAGTFGNAAPCLGYGPGFFSIDWSAHKEWAIKERTSLQFRADMYNVANRPNFSNPGGSQGSAGFGRITSVLSGSDRTVQLSLRLEF
jgi:hypothetical protein